MKDLVLNFQSLVLRNKNKFVSKIKMSIDTK